MRICTDRNERLMGLRLSLNELTMRLFIILAWFTRHLMPYKDYFTHLILKSENQEMENFPIFVSNPTASKQRLKDKEVIDTFCS